MIQEKLDDFAASYAVLHELEGSGDQEAIINARIRHAHAEDALRFALSEDELLNTIATQGAYIQSAKIKLDKMHSYLIFATWAAIVGWGAWGYLMFNG